MKFLLYSFIIKNHRNVIFGIVCDEETTIDIQECEIKGSNNKDSVGKKYLNRNFFKMGKYHCK